jgi:hypothetical protein
VDLFLAVLRRNSSWLAILNVWGKVEGSWVRTIPERLSPRPQLEKGLLHSFISNYSSLFPDIEGDVFGVKCDPI